jgi:hypothetical protein
MMADPAMLRRAGLRVESTSHAPRNRNDNIYRAPVMPGITG